MSTQDENDRIAAAGGDIQAWEQLRTVATLEQGVLLAERHIPLADVVSILELGVGIDDVVAFVVETPAQYPLEMELTRSKQWQSADLRVRWLASMIFSRGSITLGRDVANAGFALKSAARILEAGYTPKQVRALILQGIDLGAASALVIDYRATLAQVVALEASGKDLDAVRRDLEVEIDMHCADPAAPSREKTFVNMFAALGLDDVAGDTWDNPAAKPAREPFIWQPTRTPLKVTTGKRLGKSRGR